MALTRVLRSGATGTDVQEIQNMLLSLGYDVGPTGADGIYGSKTIAAVRAFQSQKNLTVDGVTGSQTYTALVNALIAEGKVASPTGGIQQPVPAPPGGNLDTGGIFSNMNWKTIGIVAAIAIGIIWMMSKNKDRD